MNIKMNDKQCHLLFWLFSFSFPDKKKSNIAFPALYSGRLLKKFLKLALKHIKHCFIWEIFKSPNGVLIRNKRNYLIGPGRHREDIFFENKKNNSLNY
jgi:hypothetical protein